MGTEPKFSVRLQQGQLMPLQAVSPPEGTPATDYFSNPKLSVPKELEVLIAAGSAQIIDVDDQDTHSAVAQLFASAYAPDRVTFIRYNSGVPLLSCSMGEYVPLVSVWPKVARASRTALAPDKRAVFSFALYFDEYSTKSRNVSVFNREMSGRGQSAIN
ncbi:MAG TPA: hypothetical protein VJW77_06655 [Terriglobia bacterium]|nr:hypothetical protein [Terriglobia bacterium]